MDAHESQTFEIRIPTTEQPPRYIVSADTGEIPTIEYYPGRGETREQVVGRLTRSILQKLVGVNSYDGRQESGTYAYSTKPIDPERVAIEEGYRLA